MKILFLSANTETFNMPVLPMGLASVAAAAARAGHETHVLNLMEGQDPISVLRQAIAEVSPGIIGISVRNIDDQDMQSPRFLLKPVKRIIAACRELIDAPVVLGGAGFSIFPRAALEYLEADMGIRGEGEIAFVKLLQSLSSHQALSDIPGLYLPQTGCLRQRQYIKDLSALPLPLPGRDLPVPGNVDRSSLWMPFQTRRGCPMNCSYCSTGAIEGRLIRKIPPEQAAEALERYTKAGFNRFFFVDNTFNLPPSYAEAVCDAIIARRLAISWRSIIYPWKITDRLAAKMAKSGCVEVSLGFESGSPDVLRRFNKRFGPSDVRQAAAHFKNHNISRMGFLLLGSPAETHATALESLQWADGLGLESMKLTVGIRIYPETALAATAVAEGMVAPDSDLLFPEFYIRPELNDWLNETAVKWAEVRPGWIPRTP